MESKDSKDYHHDISIKDVALEEESTPASTRIDPIAEKKLLRKLDFILLPLFGLIYCLNFIDRTAIGNARIAGLEKDLNMKGFDLNIALTIFYIFFIVVEIPSNLLLKRLGSVWIAVLVTGFGAVSLGSAFVRTYGELLMTRVFLGIAEGGTLAGLVYTLARYYRRHEFVLRMGFFFGLSPTLAGAFGGLLASGLLSLDDIGIVTQWRKIFFVEGIITTGFGLILFFIIPDDPRTTRMLNEQERALAIARINADAIVKTDGKKEKTSLKLIMQSFSFSTLLCTLCFLLVNISFQGLSLFLPTVISSLGKFTVVQTQLRAVPPFAVGCVWSILNCWMSFRWNSRWSAIALSMLFQIAGYATAISTTNSQARYAACFLCVIGGTSSGPLLLTWGTDNAAPETMRAVVTATIPGLGALGSVIAVWTYLPPDAPNYRKGNTLNLTAGAVVFVLTIVGALYFRLENAKRDRGERDYRLVNKTEEEIRDLGYRHPRFRYQL